MPFIENRSINKKDYLSTKVIYFLPLILLVPTQAELAPWWPFPSSGPIIFMFIASIVLLILYVFEIVRDSKIIKLTMAQKIFLFWIIHTFISYALVVSGFRSSLELIGARIYTGIPPYFLAFMVFLVIEKNKWRIKEFEKVTKVLLFVSLVWSIESFFTFYLNYPIPGLTSILKGSYWFSSGITGSLHTVSKASLLIFWLSLYMYFMHKKPFYLLFSLGASLTILSVINRASIALLMASLALFVYVVYLRYPEGRTKNQNSLTVGRLFKGLLGLFATFVVIAGGYFINNNKGSLLEDSHAFIERAYQYARATEVIIQYPYGAGAGLGFNLCYSQEAPQIYTAELRNTEPFATFSQFYQSGMLGVNMQQKFVGEDAVFSIHNFSLNVVMDYGVFGLAIIIAYIIWLFKFLKFVKLLYHSRYHTLVKTFMCLILAQGSVFVAMQATYKFFGYMWLLVFMFLFAKQVIKGSIREQKEQIQLNKGDFIPLSEAHILGKI